MSKVFEVPVTQVQEWAINGDVDFDEMPMAGEYYEVWTHVSFGAPFGHVGASRIDEDDDTFGTPQAFVDAMDELELSLVAEGVCTLATEREVWHIVKDYSIVRYRVHSEYGQTSWLTWEKAEEYLEKLGLDVWREVESYNHIEVYTG